jgi:hypothetical protein
VEFATSFASLSSSCWRDCCTHPRHKLGQFPSYQKS